MLGNEADAQDATQDALLGAVRALDRFDGRSAFGTWLYRIATNACLDELRRRRRRPVPGLPEDPGAAGDADAGPHGLWRAPPGPHRPLRSAFGHAAGDPADEASAKADVDDALRTLPPEFRAAVVLRDLCGLSYEEIADVLDIPVGTVRSRIARGRAGVAQWMGAAPGPPHGRRGNQEAPPDVQARDGEHTR